jgi:hypothetical protein
MSGKISNHYLKITADDNNEDGINSGGANGDGVLEISDEVLKFALDCASNNKYKCFNASNNKYKCFYKGDVCGYYTKSLIELMFDRLQNDNRYLFDRYMKVLVCDENNGSCSNISLVNCVLQVLCSVSLDATLKELNVKARAQTNIDNYESDDGDDSDGDDGCDKSDDDEDDDTDSNTTTLKQSDIETICRLDTNDDQFWMPLSMEKKQRSRGPGRVRHSVKEVKVPVTEARYVSLMSTRAQDIDKVTLKTHYQRMKEFSKRFLQKQNSSGDDGDADDKEKDFREGSSCWWEYGQLKQKFWKNGRRWNRFCVLIMTNGRLIVIIILCSLLSVLGIK